MYTTRNINKFLFPAGAVAALELHWHFYHEVLQKHNGYLPRSKEHSRRLDTGDDELINTGTDLGETFEEQLRAALQGSRPLATRPLNC